MLVEHLLWVETGASTVGAEAPAPEPEPNGRRRSSQTGRQSAGRAEEGLGREPGSLDLGRPCGEVRQGSPQRSRGLRTWSERRERRERKLGEEVRFQLGALRGGKRYRCWRG